jgi:hypothetical protein
LTFRSKSEALNHFFGKKWGKNAYFKGKTFYCYQILSGNELLWVEMAQKLISARNLGGWTPKKLNFGYF